MTKPPTVLAEELLSGDASLWPAWNATFHEGDVFTSEIRPLNQQDPDALVQAIRRHKAERDGGGHAPKLYRIITLFREIVAAKEAAALRGKPSASLSIHDAAEAERRRLEAEREADRRAVLDASPEELGQALARIAQATGGWRPRGDPASWSGNAVGIVASQLPAVRRHATAAGA